MWIRATWGWWTCLGLALGTLVAFLSIKYPLLLISERVEFGAYLPPRIHDPQDSCILPASLPPFFRRVVARIFPIFQSQIRSGLFSARIIKKMKDSQDVLPQTNSMDTLNENSSEKPFLPKMKKHLAQEVSTDHANILMLVCCLITGFLDSTLYNGIVDTQRSEKNNQMANSRLQPSRPSFPCKLVSNNDYSSKSHPTPKPPPPPFSTRVALRHIA